MKVNQRAEKRGEIGVAISSKRQLTWTQTLCPGVAASIYRATQPQYSVSSRNHSMGELQRLDAWVSHVKDDVSMFVCPFVLISFFSKHRLLFLGVTAQRSWRPFCQDWSRSWKTLQSSRISTSSPLTLPKILHRRVWVSPRVAKVRVPPCSSGDSWCVSVGF